MDRNNGPKSRVMSAHEAARDPLTVPCPSINRAVLARNNFHSNTNGSRREPLDSPARINGEGCSFAQRELVDRKFDSADSTWRLNTNFLGPTSSSCPRRIDFKTRPSLPSFRSAKTKRASQIWENREVVVNGSRKFR